MLGVNFLKRGELEEAERLHMKALRIFREIKELREEAETRRTMGNVAVEREDYESAERNYREYVRIFNKIGLPLPDWYIENGYTDSDADWDFP